MTEYDEGTIKKVRTLTDYDERVLPDDDLEVIMDIAREEIEAEVIDLTGDHDIVDEIRWDRFPGKNALLWTSCLFSKIKAGEIDGVPMSLGDMDMESLSTGGDEVPIWVGKIEDYTNEVLSEHYQQRPGTGIRSPNRHGYPSEPETFYD